MELLFEKDDLLQATKLLQGTVGRPNEMPILAYLLISAERALLGNAQKDKIQMSATDLEISIQIQVNGTIIQPGSITIPARKLFDLIRELPPSVVKLNKTANERAIIECEHGRYTMIGLPVDEFPQVASMPNQFFTVKTATFKDALINTAFAASKDETRSSLNGVFFHLQKSASRLVAADGKKLALVEIPINALYPPLWGGVQPPRLNRGVSPTVEVFEEISVIVPIKAIGEIQKLFKEDEEENLKVSIAENQIFFTDNKSMLSARLIEGEFPNYNIIIPKDNQINIQVDTQKLLSALRRVSVLANSETRRVIFEIQGGESCDERSNHTTAFNGMLNLSATDASLGDAYEEVEISAWDDNITIAFDSKSVIEILSHIDSEIVVLNLKGPFSPAIIKPFGDYSYLYLIAPMRQD